MAICDCFCSQPFVCVYVHMVNVKNSVQFPYLFLMTSLLKKMCRAQFSILQTWVFAKENAPLSS